MKFNLKLVTAPAEAPVSVTEAKEYLRVDNNLEDARIGVMIDAATRYLEGFTSLKFVTQTWDVFADHFPFTNNNDWWDGVKDGPISMLSSDSPEFILPIGPAQSLVAFETFADDGVAIPELVSNYVFDDKGDRARVALKTGGVWPVTILRRTNGIKFRVTVGFGNAASVPADIKQAILEMTAHIYETRGDQTEAKVPAHVHALIEHRRRVKVGR